MADSDNEDETGAPPWDQEKADGVIGKYALVGVTWLEADGETVENQGQYHGRIVVADRNAGIKIECEGAFAGKSMNLPPDLRAFSPADPGEYRLRSTGEVVNDPDVLGSWTVKAPLNS